MYFLAAETLANREYHYSTGKFQTKIRKCPDSICRSMQDAIAAMQQKACRLWLCLTSCRKLPGQAITNVCRMCVCFSLLKRMWLLGFVKKLWVQTAARTALFAGWCRR